MLAKQAAAKGPKLSVGSKFERRYKINKNAHIWNSNEVTGGL